MYIIFESTTKTSKVKHWIINYATYVVVVDFLSR